MHVTTVPMVFRAQTIAFRSIRSFATTRPAQAKNRLYPSRIRNEDELQTLLLASASTRIPLLTLWMTTWSRDCDEVSPIIRELLERDGIGEDKGSVGFVEVEMDSPDLGGVSGIAQRYMINKIPTLMAFDRQEPQTETKVSDLRQLKSKEFLRQWIEKEAARHGTGGAGGSLSGLFRMFRR